MGITENIDRIEQGKTSIISSIKSKGVNVPSGVLINEIAPYINEIQGGGGGDVPEGEIVPGGPHNPENDAFQEDFLWIENVDDKDGTITLKLDEAPFIYYSYDDDTEFQKMVSTNVLSIPAHSKIYLRWKGKITTSSNYGGFIKNVSSNCNHNIGGELKNGGLKSNVYEYLFNDDKKLIDASQLKLTATTLASYCYSYMFYGCSSLTTATELSATKLAESCYQYMFSGCTSLTTAPELPATTLADSCYSNMFYNCKALNYVKTNIISWNGITASNWLSGVASSGIVEVFPTSTITTNSTSGIPSGWSKQITSGKNTINIHNVSVLENTISIPNKFSAFKYKTNNDTEYTENPKTTALTITLKSDETLTIEGIYNLSTSSSPFTGITSSENINVYGEVNYSIPYMFQNLFNGNKKLIDASELKLTATTLTSSCYYSMFNGCSSLTTAPNLPATTLADSCYYSMFYGCSSLTTAPNLPATTLKRQCYHSMFRDCSSLTTAPELPATQLASSCYSYMFYDCSSLTTAPSLPATILVSSCYNQMFYGCSKLNSLTFLSTEPFIYNDNMAKSYWLNSVASTGTFRTPIENKEWLDVYPRGTSAVPSGWTIEYIEIEEPDENEDILIIENVDEVEGTVKMNNPNNIAIQYSTDGSQFNDYTTETEIPIGVGEKVYFKWSEVISNSSNSTALVQSSVKYNVYGELKQGNNKNAYLYMFRDESNLINASQLKLTATELAERCYHSMFYGCTSLTTTPTLPATTLADSCYSQMFDNCSSLTIAPALPATTLAKGCYQSMFRNCTNLTTAPAILPATQLTDFCYTEMFSSCSSLTTAPTLPAMELANYSYQYMFNMCRSLNYVKHHVVDWDTEKTNGWLRFVASNGTMYCPLNSTIPSNDASGLPDGWIKVAIE